MRGFIWAFGIVLFAFPASAKTLEVETDVSAVTVFTNGALITREVFLDLEPGQHQIVLREPSDSFQGIPTIILPAVDSIDLVSVEVVDIFGVPVPMPETAIYLERLRVLEEARQALADFKRGDIPFHADIAAAEATLRAVDSLAGPQGRLVGSEGALDPDATINLITRLSVKAFEAQAKLDKAEAELDARDIERAQLDHAVELALDAIDDLFLAATEISTIVITVDVERRMAGAIKLESYSFGAAWTPVYRVDLDYEKMKGTLGIVRQAVVQQSTNLDWTDVRLRLSTADPTTASGVVLPKSEILSLRERPELAPVFQSDGVVTNRSLAEPMVEAVEIVEEQPFGITNAGSAEPVEFLVPRSVTLASHRDSGLLVEIDSFEAPVELFAEAVATRDTTAMLGSEFTYDRGGLLLAGETQIFHNGAFVGRGSLPEIASGDSAKIGLGPLKSVLVKHRILSREEGDRGLITSSNAREVRTETEIVNLLNHRVPMRLYDVIPVSEAEDLRVVEVSQPSPDDRRVEGRRGVFQWNLELDRLETQVIRFGYDLAWPKDQIIVAE
ncbi:MAG: mucoidy inhibitor MuiA family protein [Pseudomonadota bacterium]